MTTKAEIKAMEADLDKKQQRACRLNGEIGELKDKIFVAQELPQLKGIVGKCFRFSNSRGGQEGKRWWLYCRIVSFDGPRWVKKNMFQDDEQGRIWFDVDQLSIRQMAEDGYEEIPLAEYEKCKRRILKKLEKRL